MCLFPTVSVIQTVAMVDGCDRQRVYKSALGRRNVARILVVHFAGTSGQLTHRDIAEALGHGALQRGRFQPSQVEATA